jgi:hypothetical protein
MSQNRLRLSKRNTIITLFTVFISSLVLLLFSSQVTANDLTLQASATPSISLPTLTVTPTETATPIPTKTPVPTPTLISAVPVVPVVAATSTSRSMATKECILEGFKLVVELAKVLVWPLVVIFLIRRYGQNIARLIDRVTEESVEISSSFLGLTAKFRKEIADISAEFGAEDNALQTSLQQRVRNLAKDEFRVLSTYFFGYPLDVRKRAAVEIAKLAADLSLDDVLDFSQSPFAGERVGAGVTLRTKIESSPSIVKDQRVINTLGELLNDSDSRVRYRAVRAVSIVPELVTNFYQELEQIAKSDANSIVRKAAREALNQ